MLKVFLIVNACQHHNYDLCQKLSIVLIVSMWALADPYQRGKLQKTLIVMDMNTALRTLGSK